MDTTTPTPQEQIARLEAERRELSVELNRPAMATNARRRHEIGLLLQDIDELIRLARVVIVEAEIAELEARSPALQEACEQARAASQAGLTLIPDALAAVQAARIKFSNLQGDYRRCEAELQQLSRDIQAKRQRSADIQAGR